MKAVERTGALSVLLDGVALDAADADALTGVRVQQRLSQPSHCELIFSNPQVGCAQRNQALPGSRLTVGVDGHLGTLFEGRVTAVEHIYSPSGEREVVLRAYDALHALRHRQPVRTHVQVTFSDLARELVNDMGLRVESEELGPLWQRLVQAGQSDLDLLVEAAERCGVYFFLNNGNLCVFSLRGQGDAVAMTVGEELLEVRIEVNSDPACDAVTALGWDPWRADDHRGTGTAPRSGVDIPASASGLREHTLVNESIQNDDQAAALAQAELDRRRALSVRLTGVADGNPLLRPGRLIKVSGVDSAVCGSYILAATTHIFDRSRGFVTQLDTWPPPRRRRHHDSAPSLGIVTDVDDPEKLGRVRVRMPGFGDVESDWLGVLCPGAGRDKGLVALPHAGDRVLIIATRGDPGQALVLGGLYGAEGPPDDGVDAGERRRWTLATSDGQRLQLDDTKHRVRLQSRGGNRLDISPDRVRLSNGSGCYLELKGGRIVVHAQDGLELEAPDGRVVIRGRAIDLERG